VQRPHPAARASSRLSCSKWCAGRCDKEKWRAGEKNQAGRPSPAVSLLSEEELIRQAMLQVGGNKSKAAKLLDVDRSTLYRKIKRYRIA
jgi:transcriptional regulator of acetoin/glycerol metabolism